MIRSRRSGVALTLAAALHTSVKDAALGVPLSSAPNGLRLATGRQDARGTIAMRQSIIKNISETFAECLRVKADAKTGKYCNH